MFADNEDFDQDLSFWEIDDSADLTSMFAGADLMISNQGFSVTPTAADFNQDGTHLNFEGFNLEDYEDTHWSNIQFDQLGDTNYSDINWGYVQYT